MRKTAIVGVVVSGALAGWAAVLAAPAQERPGDPTKAVVWVQNRDPSEAIPVIVQAAPLAQPLSVDIATMPIVQTRHDRQLWEYREVTVAAGQSVAALLTQAGADGWEATGGQLLSAGGGTVWLLKRPQ